MNCLRQLDHFVLLRWNKQFAKHMLKELESVEEVLAGKFARMATLVANPLHREHRCGEMLVTLVALAENLYSLMQPEASLALSLRVDSEPWNLEVGEDQFNCIANSVSARRQITPV